MKRCLFLSFICFLLACSPEDISPVEKKGILFLGHTYRWHTASDKVDERIEQLNLEKYESIWLGGDICSETSEQRATFDYLDRLFDLKAPTTLWAPGNHDLRRGNWDWFTEATGRNLHYVQNYPDYTVMVANTYYNHSDHCAELQDQWEMIRNTCDTIRNASHLILLTHLVTWSDVEEGMNAESAGNTVAHWWPFTCEENTRFKQMVFPKLQEVQERGIQVMVISGDAGKNDKSFAYQTQGGIWLLASGINNSFEKDPEKRALLPKDRVLYLEYDQEKRRFYWRFLILDDLLLDRESL